MSYQSQIPCAKSTLSPRHLSVSASLTLTPFHQVYKFCVSPVQSQSLWAAQLFSSSCGRQATNSSGKQPREEQELARVQLRPVPSNTPPRLFLGPARRKLVELSPRPLCSQKTRLGTPSDSGLPSSRLAQRLQLLSQESPSREARPTPTPAEPPGNGALSRAEELTQEALSGPCCFHRLTPFNLAPYSWMRPRRGGVALTVTPLRVYGSALDPGRLDPQTT